MSMQTKSDEQVGEYSAEELRALAQQTLLAEGDRLHPEVFPQLDNVSAGWTFRVVIRPAERKPPEYVYIPVSVSGLSGKALSERLLTIILWNMMWESGQLRYDLFEERLSPDLHWLENFADENLYLVLKAPFHRYEAYAPLYHLLPQETLRRFRLPLLKRGIWPAMFAYQLVGYLLPQDFDSRLAHALAWHLWPLLNPGSALSAFSPSDPIHILAHNLDYWLPYISQVAEARLQRLPRIEAEDEKQAELVERMRREAPDDVRAELPLGGGAIWQGEEDAWQATCEMVEAADAGGRLRAILDAIRSNRVADDFSDRWSHDREDFERKLNHKRAKVKVAFVELPDTIPVHGPDSEVHENLLWEDFLAVLDQKERRVVVCLRSGLTRATEISQVLGYANHSPVSKALARIRRKAVQYFDS